ncbi:hypothetical protein ACFQHV_10355 [Promicromonospora thailandica]|uniref:hypothetical protein n=1 Tax=Promicromonospora thailandica TaxID=765201 RepID=UPI0020A3DC22|nr:hypothetical protein [Promicromonospora thailandica]BFF18860.1 hypothetical protein GCM10025730_23810 [Promicromonospora thailandica]
MVKEWEPGLERDLLRGPRAGKLAVLVAGGAVIFVVYTISLFAGMAVAGVGYRVSPVLTVVFVIWGSLGCVVVGLNLYMHIRVIPREVRAGYTTGYRIHKEVDYVDPDTGHVLRVAGEEFLKTDERRRREALVAEAVDKRRAAGDGRS